MKNNLKKWAAFTCASCAVVSGAHATWTSTNAFVTPKSITIQAKAFYLSAIDSNNRPKGELTIWVGSKTLTFARSDTSFQRVSIGNIAIPAGRYNGVGILYSQLNESIRMDGNKQEGSSSVGAWDATTTWYSNSQSSTTDNSVTTVANTSGELTNIFATAGTATGGTSADNTSYGFFAPVCVSRKIPAANVNSSRKATADIGGCKTGDEVVRIPTRVPAITVVYDLTHYMGLDTTTNSARKSPSYPIPMIGDSGVAIHITAVNTAGARGVGDVSLIYNDAGDLVYGATWSNSLGEEQAKFGQGIGSGTDSRGNYASGLYNNSTGSSATVAGVTTANGEVQIALGGQDGVRGVVKLSDPRVACNTAVTLTPIATSSSVFNATGFVANTTNLAGFTPTGVAFSGSAVVRKVVNPGSVSGFPATCAYPSAASDGYY